MIWRRNVTETQSGLGMGQFWTSLRRRSLTSRRAQPPLTRAGQATATSGSQRPTWAPTPRTWSSGSSRRRRRGPGRREICSRWWTRSSLWSRWRWRRRNRRKRIIQTKNVSMWTFWKSSFLVADQLYYECCWHLLSGLEWKYDLSPTLDPCEREGNSCACKCSLNHINIR